MATGHELRLNAEGSSAPAAQDSGRGADGRLTLAARLALVAICLAVFLSALDQYALVTLLVDPRNSPLLQEVGISSNQIDRAAWILNGYILGYIIAMPLMGRIADIYGRRLIFAMCLAIFAVGSLFCALAPALGSPIAPDATTLDGAMLTPLYDLTQMLLSALSHIGVDTSLPALTILVGARFIQAIGGGALVPVAIAVVGDLYGATRRGLALGVVGAIAEAGGVLGPLWGAWITSRFSWEWIFYLNLPITLLLLVAGLAVLPRIAGVRGRVDVLGAVVLGAFLVCLSLGFGLQAAGFNVRQPSSVVAPKPQLLIAAVFLLALFVMIELFRRSPAIDIRQFGKRAFSAASVLSFLAGVPLVVTIVLIPAFVTWLQSSDNLAGAFALLRMTAFIPVGAFAGGWLASRLGCPPAALLGSLLTAVGLYLMSLWPANVGVGQMTLATLLVGLGFGLVIAPTSTSALNAAGVGREGTAAAVITVLRMAGMLLGASWALLWAVSRFTELSAGATFLTLATLRMILHEIFIEIFRVAAVIALASVVPALLLWRKPRAGDAAAQEGQGYASYVAPLT